MCGGKRSRQNSLGHGSGNNSFGGVRWMNSMSRSFDDRIETIMVIGGIMDGTGGTIGFYQRVRSLYNITITLFMMGFLVAGVCVLHAIVELVFGMRLIRNLIIRETIIKLESKNFTYILLNLFDCDRGSFVGNGSSVD